MTVASDLQTAKEQMAANLVTLTTNPKTTYNVSGVSYSWTEYQKFLMESIANINALISAELDGPFEVLVQGET